MVAVDNVPWGASTADSKQNHPDTQAIRVFNPKLVANERVSLSMVPIGDRLTPARKRG